MQSHINRRAILAGAASLPATALPALPALAEPDPIFAVLKRHLEGEAIRTRAWDSEDEERLMDAAWEKLDYEGLFVTTAPTTLAGLRAVIEFALTDRSRYLQDAFEDVGDAFLENVLECLENLAAA